MYYLDNVVLEGNKNIDYLVLTHPDSDHMGNMLDIIDKYSIGTFIRPRIYTELENKTPMTKSVNYLNLISKLDSKNITTLFCDEVDKIADDGFEISFLTHYCISDLSDSSTNKYSSVIKLSDNGHKLLLTSDIDYDCENSLIDKFNKPIKLPFIRVKNNKPEVKDESVSSKSDLLKEYNDANSSIEKEISMLQNNIDKLNKAKELLLKLK